MIKEIKEALEKETPRWHYNGNEIVSMDNLKYGIGGFMTDEDNHLAANAPEWLRYLIGEVERKNYLLRELKGAILAIDNIVNVAIGHGEQIDLSLLSVELNRMVERLIDSELGRSEQP